jgi:hypothetical protein
MRTNWKVIVLTAMFVIQTVLVFAQDRLFNEAMELKRERVQRTQAISSVMQETQYEVSSYVRNVVLLSLMSNFGMLVVAASSKSKDAA